MKTIKSIFKIYNIEKALVKEGNKLEIVILKRNENISMNRWIDFINSLKGYSCKEVEFILESDAKQIYNNFDDFNLIEVKEND